MRIRVWRVFFNFMLNNEKASEFYIRVVEWQSGTLMVPIVVVGVLSPAAIFFLLFITIILTLSAITVTFCGRTGTALFFFASTATAEQWQKEEMFST